MQKSLDIADLQSNPFRAGLSIWAPIQNQLSLNNQFYIKKKDSCGALTLFCQSKLYFDGSSFFPHLTKSKIAKNRKIQSKQRTG